MFCWAIWNHKNGFLHRKEVRDDARLVEAVLSSLAEFQKACLTIGFLPTLACVWKPPPQDYFKINVDGAVSLEQGCSAIRMVIRDWTCGLCVTRACP